MMKGETVYVPADAPDVYQNCPKNRKQVTIIEGINAAGESIPPFIIIQGVWHLGKWYNSKQSRMEVIEVSDTGYTNANITLDWL
jgi:hypothetical protein